MARISRHELKQDELIDTVEQAADYLERHGRAILTVALVLVLGGGSAGAYLWYAGKQAAKASAALGKAMTTYQASVQAGLPALPGEGPQRVFTSKEEKYQAALEEFAVVQEEYPRTRQAQLARHFEALCRWRLGEQQKAISLLEELTASADPEVAAVSKYHLAGFYENLGRFEGAKKLYRDLVDNPAATVPRAAAQMALAELLMQDEPAEARKLLEAVRDDYPDTRVASEARRRLDLLPSAPASQAAPEPPAAEQP